MAGVGFGPAWTGAYRIIVAETSPQQRTGLAAAIFDVAYLFKAFPPMAGVATQRFGLHDTAVGWTALIACASLLQQSARASITADQANEAPAAHAPSPPPAPAPSHPPAASPATLKQHARHDDDAACSVQWFRG
jgi:hypothetical protein